jgi:hypothetical protein
MMATQELVVPRSMPMTLPMMLLRCGTLAALVSIDRLGGDAGPVFQCVA